MAQPQRNSVVSPGAVLLFFASALGGIWVAIGSGPGNIFALVLAPLGCMVARAVLADPKPRIFGRGLVWFTILSWCAMAGPVINLTSVPRSSLDAQAVLGPLPLSADPWRSIPASVALIAGLAAAAWWCHHHRTESDEELEKWMRAAEATLSGTIVSATLWGPSLVAPMRGPLTTELMLWTATSLLVNVLAIAGVVVARDRLKGAERWWMWPTLVSALAALGAGMVGAWV